jgi:hypothetical protein
MVCGYCTAEWIRTDARRTSIGLDLDLESHKWCIENNFRKIGGGVDSSEDVAFPWKRPTAEGRPSCQAE